MVMERATILKMEIKRWETAVHQPTCYIRPANKLTRQMKILKYAHAHSEIHAQLFLKIYFMTLEMHVRFDIIYSYVNCTL